MNRLCILAIAATLAAQPTWAAGLEGKYGPEGGIEIKKTSDGSYTTHIFASISGCIAETTGNGHVENNILRVVSDDDDQCVLTITSTKTGIVIKESKECLSDHGARCSFEGKYSRK